MQKNIQIYPCLLKLSRKQESVMDGQTDGRYYYIPRDRAVGRQCRNLRFSFLTGD